MHWKPQSCVKFLHCPYTSRELAVLGQEGQENASEEHVLKMSHCESKCRLSDGLCTVSDCTNMEHTLTPFHHTYTCLTPAKFCDTPPPPKKKSTAENMRFSSKQSPGNPRSWAQFFYSLPSDSRMHNSPGSGDLKSEQPLQASASNH